MALFDIPTRSGRDNDNNIAKKANAKSKVATTPIRGGSNTMVTIQNIVSTVNKNLGSFKATTTIIQDADTLNDYIDESINFGYLGIDTETTGLNPKLDKIVGICIYVPTRQEAYIPINHISYITGERVANQLSIDVLKQAFERVRDNNVKNVMFNAVFDIRFILNHIGVKLDCYWDCSIASRLMNENEEVKNLKHLHNKYVLDGKGDAFKFDSLFKGITFDKVPIDVGALYAAHDPKITYELYEYQKQYLYYEPECSMDDRNGMNGVAWVFFNIEMPIVNVVVEMEENGVAIDMEYNKELSEKYNKTLAESIEKINAMTAEYEPTLEQYRQTMKIDKPLNIGSPKQLEILLFDVIGLDAGIDKKTKKPIRGTGEDILSSLDHPICKAVLEYRTLSKLVSTYIDKLPECVNPNDGRIHCKFNQYGADTGRFSSNDPNLQNIPSHNKDIRKMFVASKGCVLMSSDFSQQENCECIQVGMWCEVETPNGWKYADKIVVGDVLKTQDDFGKDTTIIVNKIVVDKSHITYYY